MIDYSIVSDFFFQHLNCLIIKPLTHLSDHCQSVTVINTLFKTWVLVSLQIQPINGTRVLTFSIGKRLT